MAKGIRVNALAKELGVESKVILEKCRQEGLADKVPNHQSTIALGLAETIREWHSSGALEALIKQHGGSAEAAPAKKKKSAPKKKTAGGHDEEDAGGVATLVEDETHTGESAEETTTESAPEVVAESQSVVETPAAPEAAEAAVADEAAVTPTEVVAEAPAAPATAESLVTRVTPPAAPVVPAAPAAPAAATAGPKAVGLQPTARPTVKLESRTGLAKPERPKAMAPAFTPRKAELQGPKVIREEKPDIVSAPRKKMLPGQGPTGGSGITQAQPRGGRG